MIEKKRKERGKNTEQQKSNVETEIYIYIKENILKKEKKTNRIPEQS